MGSSLSSGAPTPVAGGSAALRLSKLKRREHWIPFPSALLTSNTCARLNAIARGDSATLSGTKMRTWRSFSHLRERGRGVMGLGLRSQSNEVFILLWAQEGLTSVGQRGLPEHITGCSVMLLAPFIARAWNLSAFGTGARNGWRGEGRGKGN